MAWDLILNATVIAAIIGAAAVIGTYYLRRYDEGVKKKDLARDGIDKKKDKAHKELRVILAGLSDRAGPVTFNMLKETDNRIQTWAASVGYDSQIYKAIQVEHNNLHGKLDTTFAKTYSKPNKEAENPVSEDDWQEIKDLREALKTKLG